jgi:hypothetical protein
MSNARSKNNGSKSQSLASHSCSLPQGDQSPAPLNSKEEALFKALAKHKRDLNQNIRAEEDIGELLYQFIREHKIKLILILAIQKKTKALLARKEVQAQNGGEEDNNIPRSRNHREGDEDEGEDEEDNNPQPTKCAHSNRLSMDIEESAYAEQFQDSLIPGANDSGEEDQFSHGKDLDEDKQYYHADILPLMQEEDNMGTNTLWRRGME